MIHRLMNTVRLLLIISFGLYRAAHAAGQLDEPSGMLTLTQALVLAEERHPELNSARLESEAADGRVTQAAARQNPALSFEAENFGGKGEQEGFDTAGYTAQIEQVIELGGKRGKRIRIAAAEREITGLDFEASRLDIRAETTRRFVGVLGAQAHAALAKENVALAEDFAEAVAARVQAGKVPPMELETAHVLLAQKRIALDKANGDLAAARIHLAGQWGNVRPIFECAAGDLGDVPSIPHLPALTSRLRGNPDVKRRTVEIELAHAVLAQRRAVRVSDVTVTAGFRRSNETESDTLTAGVSLPLPVFDRNEGGIREAESELAKAKQLQRAAEVKADAALATAHQLLATAARRASALKEGVLPRIKAVLEAVQSGYAQGKYTYLDVLDAQRTLVESRAEYIDSLIAAHTALADLERITCGQLQIQK